MWTGKVDVDELTENQGNQAVNDVDIIWRRLYHFTGQFSHVDWQLSAFMGWEIDKIVMFFFLIHCIDKKFCDNTVLGKAVKKIASQVFRFYHKAEKDIIFAQIANLMGRILID